MALTSSDLTIFKNKHNIPTALGHPINSCLLRSNIPLFINDGGNGRKKKEKEEEIVNDKYKAVHSFMHKNKDNHLAVPVGLLCINNKTYIEDMDVMDNIDDMEINNARNDFEDNSEVISDNLYDSLLRLAEEMKKQKMTRKIYKPSKNNQSKKQKPKTKTRKNRNL